MRADGFASARPPDVDAIRSPKQVEAVAIDEPIRIDGVVDEPAWDWARPATDFYQQQPAEFELATRRTEARFLYDRDMFLNVFVQYNGETDTWLSNMRDNLIHRP